MKSSLVSEDVVLVRTEPSDQSPCPDQTVEYECQIMTPTDNLQWTLPTEETLSYNAAADTGSVETSTDGTYRATLTSIVGDPNSNRFFFTSTLTITETTNGSVLRCSGAVGGDSVEEDATIILSGKY